ncbi:MAG TPA: hypothetical protein EYG93_00375 [Sulfurospirillum arcachonense]|nr:hypothetical protein [Sulfurospirillum arcachonense]HIP43779.1 hypothetical protein [Sulfurospirillum arcachonense]
MYKYILVLVSIFLVGCSPVYVTKNQYIAPRDKSFSQCVGNCEEKKITCDKECNNNYQVCIRDGFYRAQDISDSKFAKYDVDYEDYLIELRDFKYYKYEFDKNYIKIQNDYSYFSKECNSKKKNYACSRKIELKNALHVMKRDRLKRPKEPRKPNFDAIFKRQQKLCKRNCGCSKSFDICYVGCGGEVIPYRLCIKNCD